MKLPDEAFLITAQTAMYIIHYTFFPTLIITLAYNHTHEGVTMAYVLEVEIKT